MKAGIWE